jgi:hypothetical protein
MNYGVAHREQTILWTVKGKKLAGHWPKETTVTEVFFEDEMK